MASPFFCGGVTKKKKKTTTSVTFFDGFVTKNGNDNYCHLFQWFCYEEGDGNNVVAFFYGDGVMKKAMATCSLFFSFSLVFGSSSLELTINNEMVVFLLC